MTSGVRLLALLTLIALSVWLGFLLGKGAREPLQEVVVAAPTVAPAPVPAAKVAATTPSAPDARERLQALGERIDYLAAQTDDRVIARERALVLGLLGQELAGSDAPVFLSAMRYYNETIVRDGTALLMESAYYQRHKRYREALEPLLTAAEFPESNEQLSEIRARQAELIEAVFAEHAALEDWQGLINYLDSMLLQDPNNDRIRLHLASAQARSGDVDSAIATLEITGTQAGVSQSQINELRDSLLRSEVAPIRFRAVGNALIANASLNASPIELLVDTGATKTALATGTLRRLGAYPLNKTAQVMTAAGRITAQLYEVPELVVEDTLFRNRTVLALDNPPARWDGLLGMDLLRDMNVDLSNQLDGG